jgi:HTH-type transcriptional regulator, sugar sensing transcriptional regulator
MVVNELLKLGISKKEAEVYLAALQLGESTVQQIAKKAEINRTTAYTHIKNLIARGLINTNEKFGRQVYVAEKPEKLHLYYDRLFQEVKSKREVVDNVLPQLELLYSLAANKPSVRLFAKSEFQELKNAIVKKRAESIQCVFNYEKFKNDIDPAHMHNLLESTGKLQEIYIAKEKKIDKRMQKFLADPKYEIRFLPQGKYDFNCEIVCLDDAVVISRGQDVLWIKDELFCETMKLFFSVIWQIAEKIS